MELFIGKRIQQLRKRKRFTQEQIAKALGITTSAVSKWEMNKAYPDITLLSPLARILGTTVDGLLDFKENLTEKEIENKLSVSENLFLEGKVENALTFCEKFLLEYPNDNQLKFQIATLYMTYMGATFDEQLLEKQFQEMLSLFEECSLSENEEMRNAALHTLAGMYMMNSDFEKAEKAVDKLPVVEKDARMMKASILYEKGEMEEAVKLEQKCLFQEVNDISLNLYSLAKTAYHQNNTDKALQILDILESAETLLEMDKVCGVNYNIYLLRAEIFCRVGNKEKAIAELEKYLYALEEGINDIGNSILYDTVELPDKELPKEYVAGRMLEILENTEIFQEILEENRFQRILGRIRKMTE